MTMIRNAGIVSFAVSMLLVVGCAAEEGTVDQPLAGAAAITTPALSRVDVSLVEFSVTVTPAEVGAGRILFLVHNDSDDDLHEFVVVRTDLTIAELPTNPDGSFDEEGDGVEVVDEIEDIPAHATHALMLQLDSGHYVLLCNRVEVEEDGEVESHFAEGMRTDFDVI